MNWLTAIVSAICAIIGALGGGSILYFKQNKKDKEADIEAKASLQWKELYERSQQEVDEAKAELREVKEQYEQLRLREEEGHRQGTEDKVSLIKENAQLQMTNQHLCFWRCNVRGCAKRVPPQEIDIIEENKTEE